MKQLIEYIYNDITHAIDLTVDKQIFRVDGFETPRLYAGLCERMQDFCYANGLVLIAKLAGRKFAQFEESGADPAACAEIRHMEWVDFEDHMTYYRNMVPETGEKLVILLLGTDMVEDKGGLNDFYAITPGKIDHDIGNQYAHLMSAELREEINDDAIEAVVNRFYGDLFKCVPKNLLKVSESMDHWLEESPTVKEAMIELFATLPDWGIPKVEDMVQSLSPRKFIDAKKSLVIEAGNFINGKTYPKVTKGTIKGIRERFQKYTTEDESRKIGKYVQDYPEGQQIQSLAELEPLVIAYVMGNRQNELREALIHTDYSIISDILNLKTKKDKIESKEKPIKGTPLTVFLEVLLNIIQTVEEPVDTVRFTLERVRLSGVPSGENKSDEEKDALVLDAWDQITVFAGGIETFLSVENWHGKDGEPVEIDMKPGKWFAPQMASHLMEEGILTTCTGNNHKIDFRIEALAGNVIVGKEKYCWNIDPTDDWLMAFSDLKDMPADEAYYLPVEIAHEMNQAFALKDEDSFAYWLGHTKRHFLTGEDSVLDQMRRDLLPANMDTVYAKICRLGQLFQIFRHDVLANGFYASITGPSNTADAFIDGYIDLCLNMSHDPVYAGKLSSLAGRFTFYFTMLPDEGPVKGSPFARQVIVPPWHPATLEKLSDRMVYIRSGMYEWNGSDQKSMNVRRRLDELVSLSTIHNSTDTFSGMENRFLTCGVPFGYYTLYGAMEYSRTFTSAQQVERKEAVFDDDFDEKDMKKITREALVLLHVIEQYVQTYPQAKRTLSLTFINPEDLQVIVAALYQYVDDERKKGLDRLYINITVLTNSDAYGTRTYLAYWINHMFTQDDALEIKAYLQVYTDEGRIEKLVPSSTDITFYFDALNTKKGAGYNFYQIQNSERMTDCRFPMVFKPMLKDTFSIEHSIDITQPQFRAATAHTQVIKLSRDQQILSALVSFVQRTMIDNNRGETISKVQNKTIWLCCIDSAMDKYSVRRLYAEDSGIIGFTTGEGSYGQMNLAITCRQTMIDDIQKRCKRRLRKIFGSWDDNLLTKAANQCMHKAKDLDGVSILKAMNPNDYDMNNYLAYLIASELVEKREDRLSVLIRLDSYRHWFSDYNADSTLVPDFLLIEADINEQPFHIIATVMEAKISSCQNMANEHIPKAEMQVLQGIRVLSTHFDPDSRSVERRYWLAQLYRAIAFLQADINREQVHFNNLTSQLNMMIEGQYEIEWHERILACEVDSQFSIKKETYPHEGNQMEVWHIGQQAIQNILQGMPVDTPVTFDPDATIEDVEEEEAYEEESDEETPDISDTKTPDGQVNDEHENRDKTDETDKPANSANEEDDMKSEVLPLENVRILIGQDNKKQDVYWEFGHAQLSNRHLLITGGSGQGKTYAIQTFLYELARQNISSVVFDYTDGFLSTKLEPPFKEALEGHIEQYYAIAGKLPINPFKRQPLNIPDLPEENLEHSATVAGRIAAIFKHVYGLGEQQFSAFYQCCKEGIDRYGDEMDFGKLRALLQNSSNKHAGSVLSKMEQFFDFDLLDTHNALDWERITDRNSKVTIFQLTNLDRHIQTVITELLLWDAWYSLTKFGNPQKPFVVVLDEAQNLSIADGSPAQKILQEGRKYGWSAWFATQFMKGALSSDEISRLQQAAETLFFKPSSEEMNSVAATLSDSSSGSAEWVAVLKKMQKGRCIVKGDRIQANGQFGSGTATLVKVSSFEERDRH